MARRMRGESQTEISPDMRGESQVGDGEENHETATIDGQASMPEAEGDWESVTDSTRRDILETARWFVENPDKVEAIKEKTRGNAKYRFLFENNIPEGRLFLQFRTEFETVESNEVAFLEHGDETPESRESSAVEPVKALESSVATGVADEDTQDAPSINGDALNHASDDLKKDSDLIISEQAPALDVGFPENINEMGSFDGGKSSTEKVSELPTASLAAIGTKSSNGGSLEEELKAKNSRHPKKRTGKTSASSSKPSSDVSDEWAVREKPPPAPPEGWAVKWSERRGRWFWIHKELMISQWAPPKAAKSRLKRRPAETKNECSNGDSRSIL
eukprot:CAMPEP_0172649684 /NCGR_PEP_ID=MMETSP1068-20121228/241913_1 /TAXON_ID=35684 /ORGANISM="Pseudopedinella elastica, Strain CCMP716" /LENGTH=331 /DNA_ID=CAMNT_0013464043 /DNA_START=135 /DNA_END=1130 /DNA_ORIENTATION=+